MSKQKVAVNFWFDQQAEEAASYYTSIFQNSKIKPVFAEGQECFAIHQADEGLVMSVDFDLEGNHFFCVSGVPAFKFSEAITLVVGCEDQEEIDYFWDKLSEGGDPESQQCGWLKDKYGVPWHVVPCALRDIMKDTDVTKTVPVMREMLKMQKIDLAILQNAYCGAA